MPSEKRQGGVRPVLWLFVLAIIAVVILGLIFLPSRRSNDSTDTPVVDTPITVDPTVADVTTAIPDNRTTETAAHDRETIERLRAQRADQSPSVPEYIHEGRTLSEWVADLYSPDQAARQASHKAFRDMGTNASPAIPMIAKLLHSTPLPNTAAWTLVNIGTNSLPVLIDALTNGNRTVRMEVAGAIGAMGGAAEEAIPALVDCLRHEHASVRANAITSLQALPKRPDLAVPALTLCLSDPDTKVRVNAATVMSKFGAAAESAIPELVRVAREDKDSDVRMRAAESLRAISPERADAEGL